MTSDCLVPEGTAKTDRVQVHAALVAAEADAAPDTIVPEASSSTAPAAAWPNRFIFMAFPSELTLLVTSVGDTE
ncbi:hypothetical protein GCM10022226_12660 [Sphaerisporangium flaviroseum]|uniref:Uncharacterized protein n=1 Tax=Sphaerisporangium flaviroseum TaxID=509199 RepID=A0ABP7HHE0_9ACTN